MCFAAASHRFGLCEPCRFEGGLVLAFRLELARPRKEGHRIAVVDLDEDYVPVGAPLVIEPAMVRQRLR